MNKIFSSEQKSKTGNLDAIVVSRHYKLDLMAKFKWIKIVNTRFRQH